MRKRFDAQIGLGQTPIEDVILPLKSRNELPPVLAGLQWIFKTSEVSQDIFELLIGRNFDFQGWVHGWAERGDRGGSDCLNSPSRAAHPLP